MKVTLMIGNNAYCVIKSEERNMDVLLSPGRSPEQSLHETVKEMRAKARRINERADFIESAIPCLKAERDACAAEERRDAERDDRACAAANAGY